VPPPAPTQVQVALKLEAASIYALDGLSKSLIEQKRYAESLQYLDKAGKAPPRPGRETADKGRRGEIATLTAKVKAKMS